MPSPIEPATKNVEGNPSGRIDVTPASRAGVRCIQPADIMAISSGIARLDTRIRVIWNVFTIRVLTTPDTPLHSALQSCSVCSLYTGCLSLFREVESMVRFAKWAALLGVLALLPTQAMAQQETASIAGVVKDASGAVLPGVTIEASSPVLIEKVRTAVSDGNGAYRIVNLPAGTYTVTFALTGFSTYKREGILLQGALNASVNADMKVG